MVEEKNNNLKFFSETILMSRKNSSNSSAEFPESSEEREVILDSLSRSSSQKQVSPKKKWCFTLNNYTSDHEEKIQSSIKTYCKIGFYNKEIGESGTPHLQGYIEFEFKKRPITIFGIKQIHWEGAKGNLDANLKYCSKDCDGINNMTFIHGYKGPTKLKVIKELRPWQQSTIELIDMEFCQDDNRSINWIYDKEGMAGKTQFCKYMTTVEKQLLIITGGGYKDIACCLNLYMDNKDFDINDRTVVFFNVPRDSDDSGMISYKALESLKDGLITSTKYESRTLVFNSPSVWVFSNNLPETHKLSADRWKIYTIKDHKLCNFVKSRVLEDDEDEIDVFH